MKLSKAVLHVAGAAALFALTVSLEPAGTFAAGHQPVTAFDNVKYYERWTNRGTKHADTTGQYEFTPAGQTNLDAWTQMVTLIEYRNVSTGDGLAKTANGVIDAYKAAGGKILRTNSVPRTSSKAAEYFMAAILPAPHYLEAAFTRLRMYGGIGTAIVYSHRFYGKNSAGELGAWVKSNGPATEQTLMRWDGEPKE